jgi:SAM-dependent methyltransferase
MAKEQLTQERNELYKRQFDLLSNGTTEYDYMVNYFRTTLFPTLPAMGHFLDIGCGRGNYARPLSEDFDQTTVVEVNSVYFDEVLGWGEDNGRNIGGYNDDWVNVKLDGELDFILMSHMLYYVDPPETRPAFIRKAYNLLKPGGLLVITLNSSGCGIRHIYKTFFPYEEYEAMPTGEEIAAILHHLGYPRIETKVYPAEITVPSHEDMGSLVDFMLMRLVSFDTEEKIAQRSEYIDEYLTRGKKYIMDSEGTMVLLRKP